MSKNIHTLRDGKKEDGLEEKSKRKQDLLTNEHSTTKKAKLVSIVKLGKGVKTVLAKNVKGSEAERNLFRTVSFLMKVGIRYSKNLIKDSY